MTAGRLRSRSLSQVGPRLHGGEAGGKAKRRMPRSRTRCCGWRKLQEQYAQAIEELLEKRRCSTAPVPLTPPQIGVAMHAAPVTPPRREVEARAENEAKDIDIDDAPLSLDKGVGPRGHQPGPSSKPSSPAAPRSGRRIVTTHIRQASAESNASRGEAGAGAALAPRTS